MEKEYLQNIKLVASDLDGTLLLRGAKEPAPSTAELIDALMDKGILFAAASGRQYPNLRNLFRDVHHEIVYMCLDGGLCVYQGKTISETVMPLEDAFVIVQDVLQKKGCEVMISSPKYENLIPKSDDFVDLIKNDVKADYRIVRSPYDIGESILKISVYDAAGMTGPAYWEKKYGWKYVVQTSGNRWLDICPIGADKGNGIRSIADYFHIDLRDVMAFGDNDNDLAMLSLVGHPVGMETGKEEVKKIAGHTTDTVENVLQQLIAL